MIIAGLSGTGTLSAKSLKNVPSLLAAVKKTWSRQQHYFCYSWDQCQTQTKKNILKEQYQRNRQSWPVFTVTLTRNLVGFRK